MNRKQHFSFLVGLLITVSKVAWAQSKVEPVHLQTEIAAHVAIAEFSSNAGKFPTILFGDNELLLTDHRSGIYLFKNDAAYLYRFPPLNPAEKVPEGILASVNFLKLPSPKAQFPLWLVHSVPEDKTLLPHMVLLVHPVPGKEHIVLKRRSIPNTEAVKIIRTALTERLRTVGGKVERAMEQMRGVSSDDYWARLNGAFDAVGKIDNLTLQAVLGFQRARIAEIKSRLVAADQKLSEGKNPSIALNTKQQAPLSPWFEIWAEGLGVDKKLFDDSRVRILIQEKDAHGAIKRLKDLALDAMADGDFSSYPALVRPENQLELVALIDNQKS